MGEVEMDVGRKFTREFKLTAAGAFAIPGGYKRVGGGGPR